VLSDDGHGCERWKGYGGAAAGALDDDGHDYERHATGDGAPAPMRDRQRLPNRDRGWWGLVSASNRLSSLPQRATTEAVSDCLSSLPR